MSFSNVRVDLLDESECSDAAVLVISLGGTVSMERRAGGLQPSLDPAALVAAAVGREVRVDGLAMTRKPGPDLGLRNVFDLAQTLREAVSAPRVA